LPFSGQAFGPRKDERGENREKMRTPFVLFALFRGFRDPNACQYERTGQWQHPRQTPH
jgi:hypothetical protein